MSNVVRIKGAAELERTFRKMPGDLRTELRQGLQRAAEPVVNQSRAEVAQLDARSAAGIRARVKGASAYVEQRKGRVTGQHPEWGAYQIRVMLRALFARQEQVVKQVESVLDTLGRTHGF